LNAPVAPQAQIETPSEASKDRKRVARMAERMQIAVYRCESALDAIPVKLRVIVVREVLNNVLADLEKVRLAADL
jgi:hypothetical protein